MNRELEDVPKAWDQFIQSPEGPEANHLYGLDQARLDEAAGRSKVNMETLHRSVKRYHGRWVRVRANIPPGFPKQLGLE